MTRARDLAAGTFEQATGGVLKLETSDTTVTDGSVLGKIEFKAPDEASGTDAILVGAAIEAVAEGTFAADNNATELVFKTGASAAADVKMTLTSGGDLLVGTTSDLTDSNISAGITGIALRANKQLAVSRTGNTVAQFNRNTSDGDIVAFRKDGTTVGSIYNGGSNLGINSSGGLLLVDDIITPTSGADTTHDIGRSSARFRNLFLYGGVFLGGTGSANKLSDYEEGTHQTAITMGTSGTATLNTSFDRFSYTKVGRLVTITGNPRISSVSSPVGAMTMTLPFTAASGQTDECRSGGVFRYYDNSAGSGSYNKPMGWHVQENTSTLQIHNVHTNGNVVVPAGSDEFYFSISYITA